ncbi:hypothetical protein [Parapedobacter koreensis]|uniref:DKNYY family protein n=1 Tax=Parapedobacter koreensis TaxID=332977 RepID=A0A1H7IJZ1_9SPHI|nr:hypothetical protein [Parapedobacter koreensis]SEK62863.1 hypothetical protein SAMN05421740_102269 [Parapedobacter koreensis]
MNAVIVKCCLAFAITLSLFKGYCQIAISADPVGGKPLTGESYLDVKGSPFLFEDWKTGNVTLDNDTEYKNVQLKYDEVEDRLIFQNHKGISQMFMKPVKSFVIYVDGNSGDSVLFSTQFSSNKTGFHQILASGDVYLLKKVKKVLMDEKQYGSAKTIRNVVPSTKYFVYKGGQLTEVKLNKRMLSEVFKDKQSEVTQYIADKRLNLKDEKDWGNVVTFYNTL